MKKKFLNLLVRLTGQDLPISTDSENIGHVFDEQGGIGYNQFNEVLLIFGYDRISPSFFKYLLQLTGTEVNNKIEIHGEPDVVSEPYLIKSIKHFEDIVESFNIIALIAYGNIKFAFKTLATSKEQVKYCYDIFSTKNINCYSSRQKPIKEINPIPANETYYLGYLIQNEIIKENKNNPDDSYWIQQLEIMHATVGKGNYNNDTYLVSDYMDVYVATSMREKHEFVLTYEFVKELFENTNVIDLNLRYFDPTQAYCDDRIDKGLTEALMLKVAACTIYQVQEKDTFGKDSELASTLAQGKSVIAYVPIGNKDYADHLLEVMQSINQRKDIREIILDYLCIFEPELAWMSKHNKLRDWIKKPKLADLDLLTLLFYQTVEAIYDKRANTLNTNHPLGIQIDLASGVACGVLVVRNVEHCALLLRRIILNEMTFNLDPLPNNDSYLPIGKEAIGLREEITGSIYRIMSKNPILSNAFWNQYNNNFK